MGRRDWLVHLFFSLIILGAITGRLASTHWLFTEYWYTIIFYAALVWLIFLFREKLTWQARFLAFYRTRVGLSLMRRLGRHDRLFRAFGDAALVTGFAGMLFITLFLLKNGFDLLFVPETPPAISLVLPGLPIPGFGIKIPLIIGWLALFIIITIHEFSHGVVANAHKVPVRRSGLFFLGPLAGAFVEPDERVLKRRSRRARLGVFAAGPFSNLLTALLAGLLLAFLFSPLLSAFIAEDGIVFSRVVPGYPAAEAGVTAGTRYTALNGAPLSTITDFLEALEGLEPGENVTLTAADGTTRSFALAAHPEDPSKAYLGVFLGTNLKEPSLGWLFAILEWLVRLLSWVFTLSIGLGLANLLPIGPFDGGRMFRELITSFLGKRKGRLAWERTSKFFLAILLLLFLFSLLRAFS